MVLFYDIAETRHHAAHVETPRAGRAGSTQPLLHEARLRPMLSAVSATASPATAAQCATSARSWKHLTACHTVFSARTRV